MSKMGEAVTRKVEQIHKRHSGLKQRKYGWLVRPLTLVVGWLVVLVGLVTIPFPGPGGSRCSWAWASCPWSWNGQIPC